MRTLSPCPDKRCISTAAQEERHAIAPFRYRKSRAEAKEALKRIAGLPRTKLVEEDDAYLHYEFTSLLLRFVDDVEFLFDEDGKTIQFRSASRVGYGDLGVNAAAWKISSRCWMVSCKNPRVLFATAQGGFGMICRPVRLLLVVLYFVAWLPLSPTHAEEPKPVPLAWQMGPTEAALGDQAEADPS
ncbi:MAG: DUF1499 domain-containing protein [Nitrospiraceae bacterium]